MQSSSNVPVSLATARDHFVYLGSHQIGNGRTVDRIGKTLSPANEIALDEMFRLRGQPIAAGLVSVVPDHDALLVYGNSSRGNIKFDFKLIVASPQDKTAAIEVIVQDPQAATIQVEGFVVIDPNKCNPIFSTSVSNAVLIQTQNGQTQIDLGTIESLTLDCGIAQRASAAHKTHRTPEGIEIYLTGDLTAGEFSNVPVMTIRQAHVPGQLLQSIGPAHMPAELAGGHVAPTIEQLR